MTAAPARFANFPERDLKVVIGDHINATTTKALTRLSIGMYEMSFMQQERGGLTSSAAKSALSAIAKPAGMTIAPEKSRDYCGIWIAANAETEIKVWVTTPFEPGQSAHLVWVRVKELAGDQKIGVSYKLATAFTANEIGLLIDKAQKALVKLDGEPFTIKGNPAPRFQKKVVAAPVAEAT